MWQTACWSSSSLSLAVLGNSGIGCLIKGLSSSDTTLIKQAQAAQKLTDLFMETSK